MTKRTKRRPIGALEITLLFLIGALALLLLAVAVIPRWMGLTAYAISSDSMSPALTRGDLAFAGPVEFDTLRPGEIIVFETEGGLVTHRVYEIAPLTRTVRTKADSSIYLDPTPIEEADLRGKVVYKLPLLGGLSK